METNNLSDEPNLSEDGDVHISSKPLRTTTKLPPFVSKVLVMLSNPQVASYFSWNYSGDCIQVKQIDEFAAHVSAIGNTVELSR